MNIMQAKFERIEEKDPIKRIERIARVCYKSEDKIDEGTDIKLVSDLINRGHMAMLEHAQLVLSVDRDTYNFMYSMISKLATDISLCSNFDTHLRFTQSERNIISGNLRAWHETLTAMVYNEMNIPGIISAMLSHYTKGLIYFQDVTEYNTEGTYANIIKDFSQLTRRERMIHDTMSVLFTVDRGVTHELVRHRKASFAQESTRYCDYGNEDGINVINPLFFNPNGVIHDVWESTCKNASDTYMQLRKEGVLPQEARTILPQSTKAEIVVTANLEEWCIIFDLRACNNSGAAHPQMREIMVPLLEEAKKWYPDIFDNLVAPPVYNRVI